MAEPVLPAVIRFRRALAGVALTVAAAAVVVGLGLLAGTVAQSRVGTGSAGTVAAVAMVTVGPETTVQDVARDVAPAASGAQLAALTERIVTANSLTSVELSPGQVLRVPLG